MALPTLAQFLIPNFTLSTIIGAILILIGIFKGVLLDGIQWLLEKITGKDFADSALRWTFITAGLFMVFVTSAITDLYGTLEGKIVIGAIIVVVIMVFIFFSKTKDGQVTF